MGVGSIETHTHTLETKQCKSLDLDMKMEFPENVVVNFARQR